MMIRFLPFALGTALGRMLYVAAGAFISGTEQVTRWPIGWLIAGCVGLTTSCAYTIAAAILETKRIGSAKVKLW